MTPAAGFHFSIDLIGSVLFISFLVEHGVADPWMPALEQANAGRKEKCKSPKLEKIFLNL